MITRFFTAVLCCSTLLANEVQTPPSLKKEDSWVYLNFDDAMKSFDHVRSIAFTQQMIGIDGNALLNFGRQLYYKNHPSIVPVSETLRIPKIIHQIWIGGPVPEAFKPLMESWTRTHMGPEWEYKLWTDDNVHEIKLHNQEYYDSEENPGLKSDILKWEIIHQIGGVYVDTDFECLKSIEILHYQYDFYTAYQPLDTMYVQLGAAIFAAAPGHPILEHCVKTLEADKNQQGIPAKTGPIHFTKSFYAVGGKTEGMIDIAFPAYYFYPQGSTEKTLDYDTWIKNGAFAIHHWAKSWMPSQYRLPQFKKLNNDDTVVTWND